MAKCDICGKSVSFGNNVSHSKRRTRRIWKPNVKSVSSKVSGAPKRMNVCTGCLRTADKKGITLYALMQEARKTEANKLAHKLSQQTA